LDGAAGGGLGNPEAGRDPPPVEAAADPAPADIDFNVRVNALHGAVQATAINLFNPFLGIDLIRLGGTGLEVGLLSSLPPLAATLSNIAGARWLAARRNPKRAGAGMFAAARLLLLGIALVNLRAGHGATWRPATLVVLVGLLNLPTAVGTLSWQSVLTGLLPPPRRARALARRGIMASLAGVVTALACGFIARRSTGTSGYPWLFALAAGVGMIEVSIFLRFRGNPSIQRYPGTILPAARRLWRNGPYRAYTLCCLPFYLGWLMAWPLFLRFQVSRAHATNLWMGAFAAVNGLAAIVGNLVWTRVGDRLSARLTLPVACLLLSGVPLFYVVAPDLWGILLNNVWGGLVGSGVNLFLLVRLMEVAPPEDRVVAMGVANTVIGAVGVVGPLIGTGLLQLLPMPQIFWVPAALRFSGGLALLLAGIGFARPFRPALRGRSPAA